jgi:hydroxyethylthiazole kinase-like uncharacterized protein yjeF
MKITELDAKILKEIYKPRPDWSHKGDFGRLLIIAGSRRYTGAPALCALAALRAGCDLTRTACPESISSVVAGFSPNIIVEPLEGDFLGLDNLDHLLKISEDFDAVCIGPGLGRVFSTMQAVTGFLEQVKNPCIIDADAIHAAAYQPKGIFPKRGKKLVLTPHSQEFFSLTRVRPKPDSTRTALVRRCAKRLGTTILLKGHQDVISDGRNASVNTTGNPNMTKGGTGDVVSGICGALLARGLTPYKAACAAAYIAGSAGDLAAMEKGPGLLATDVVEKITDVIKPDIK